MKRKFNIFVVAGLIGLSLVYSVSIVLAQDQAKMSAPAKIDPGDTAWILMSAALVMFMTPGLALFYGGMVRGKNVLGTIMQSFMIIALISVQWMLFGYSLSFGPKL